MSGSYESLFDDLFGDLFSGKIGDMREAERVARAGGFACPLCKQVLDISVVHDADTWAAIDRLRGSA